MRLDGRVLLVDSDLRNPKLHRVFHLSQTHGLTNMLTGQKALSNGCIMKDRLIPNLFLLMAGPKGPTRGELLASAAMGKNTRRNAPSTSIS